MIRPKLSADLSDLQKGERRDSLELLEGRQRHFLVQSAFDLLRRCFQKSEHEG